MSAECEKCGFDIVYPDGTWPIGVCLNCSQADEIEALKRAVRRMLRALDGVDGAKYDRLTPQEAGRWAWAWANAHDKYREQVEDLIA